MGFSISSRSLYQLKSVSLRTNEEFVRLYNDVTEARRLKLQSSRVFDDIQNLGLWRLRQSVITSYVWEWETFQDCIRDADKLMKRAEKNAIFSEVLAGIMFEFEQQIFPTLWEYRFYWEDERLVTSDMPPWNHLVDQESLLRELLEVFAKTVSSRLELAHKVVVSALVLLSFVYRYLIGCMDKGGSKTYSPSSFLFRLIFVAIVLFLGSYVWIKFRQASFTANRRKRKSCQLADRASQLIDESDVPRGVYRRVVTDTRGSVTHYKYEPRVKPRREKLESGTTLKFNYLPLGSHDTPREAEIVRHLAAVLYGKEEGRPVQFEDGLCLPFPSVTEPENCPPSGQEKAVWVTHKTKELYAELLEEKARRLQLLHPDLETGSHHGHVGEASRSDPSPSAPGATSTAIDMTCLTSPHEGKDVEEQPTNSESQGLGQEALLAREVFSAFFLDSDFEQVLSSMPQCEENDFPALDDLDKSEGAYSETDRVLNLESAPGAPSTAIELTCFASPQGGDGVVEPTTSESLGLGQDALIARGVFSAFFSDSDFEQVFSRMLQWEEDDFPPIDDLDKFVGDYSETVFGFESTLLPPQSSALDISTSAIFASLPPLDCGDQGLEIIERHLNSSTAITLQQLELLPEQVQFQQRVTCQEKRPEEFSGSNVELQQKLLESEVRISELQQTLRKSEVENEKWRSICRQWRSMFRELAKLIAASDEDGSPVEFNRRFTFFCKSPSVLIPVAAGVQ